MSVFLFHAKTSAPKVLKFYSQCLSKLLLSTIVSLILISPADATGPLRIDPSNPRYFFDGNGKAVYLAGSYQNPYNLLSNGTQDFLAYFDFLAQQNHNFTRVWAWEQAPWTYDQNGEMVFTQQPYQRMGPGTALDGGLKFDITRFNQAYFDQLRDRIIAAGQRGIYVSLILFEGFSTQRQVRQVNPWLGDPFQSENNINGVDADSNRDGRGAEFFSLSSPSVTALQEAFIRKVVDTLNDLDNVLYEISGDTLPGSLAWQNHMVEYLKAYEASKPNQHPVGISQFYPKGIADVFNSSADWIVMQGTSLNPALAGGGKVLFLEASPTLLRKNPDQWVWKTFTRGYNPIYPEDSSVSSSVHAAIGQTRAYSQFVNMTSMSPSDTACSNKFCLVSPGANYLVYLPSRGAVTVDLSATNQSLAAAWFDPATGQTISGNSTSGGTQVRFTSPVGGQSVLQLLAEASMLALPTGTTNIESSLRSLTSANSTTTQSLTSFQSALQADAVSTPTIIPNGGIYSGSVKVTLATSTPGASIYYTTDGQSPTTSSRKYKGAFALSASTLVKAIAFKNNLNPSAEASAWFSNSGASGSSFDYTLSNSGNVSVAAGSGGSSTITATLTSGSSQIVSFTVSGLPSGAAASFASASCAATCSNALTITTSSATASGNYPIAISATGGGVTKSTAFTLGVATPLEVAAPTITPNGGNFTNAVSVGIQSATSGASIYYTTNGSSPTQSSSLYTNVINLTSSATIKARAFKSGYTASREASASFAVTRPFDFSLTNSGDQSVVAGSSVSNSINAALISGSSQPVSFSFSGLPSGATGSLSANSCSPTCSIVLTISTTGSTPTGNFPITITSIGGGATKTTAFNLTVALNVQPPTITTDSTYPGYSLSPIDDAVINAAGGTSSTWASDETTTDHWINVVFPSPRQINSAIIYWAYNDDRQAYMTAESVIIQYWNGSSFQSISSLAYPGSDVPSSSAYFPTVSTSRLRFLMPAGQGNPNYRNVFWITEVNYGLDIVAPLVTAPTITPNGATFTDSVSITIQTSTSGAAIYYTTDGSTPTQSSTMYSAPITLASSAMLKAKAFKSGYTASTVASASFSLSQATISQTSGTVYYVAKSGSNSNTCTQARFSSTAKATIAAGLDCLSGGDTLIIMTGIYEEIITASKVPSGTNGNPTTIMRNSSDMVTLAPSSGTAADNPVIDLTGTSYVTVDGLRVDGTNATGNNIVHWAGGGVEVGITVKNTEIFATNIVSAASACLVGGGTGHKIVNNNIHDCGNGNPSRGLPAAHGLYIAGSSIIAEGNTIHDVSGYGIHVYKESGGISNNIVRSNNIYNVGGINGYAIIIGSGSGHHAYRNQISASGGGIRVAYNGATGNQVYNNTIYNSVDCIRLDYVYDTILQNNFCLSNSTNSISLGSSVSGTTADHNVFTTDPALVIDAGNNNFTPRSGSTLIDAGAIIAGFSYVGAAPDIGAVEAR
jgi:hypothetical protein